MNFFRASLGWTLCAILALQCAGATAAEPEQAMRTALRQLVASQKPEQTFSAVLDDVRPSETEKLRQAAAQGVATNTALTDAERARAMKIMDELVPELAARVDANLRKIDFGALALGMYEAVYPKYFSVQEVRRLAAFYATPAYQKTMATLRVVHAEHARTGKDKEQLWRVHGRQITAQEQREFIAFTASPLAQKQRAIASRIRDDSDEYIRRTMGPALAAAAAEYRQLILEKMAQDQAH